MANWTNLKAAIADTVNTNNNQEITGATLQSTLNAIVNAVGANATFAGIAIPSTNPGVPDGPVFYLAVQSGIYSNFNAIEILSEDIGVFLIWNGSWTKTKSLLTVAHSLGYSENVILTQKAATEAIEKSLKELFIEELTPNFTKGNRIASGTFNAWWGFSTVSDLNSRGYMVAIDFGAASSINKTWRYRLGKKVRDANGVITGLTTVPGSEGVIDVYAGYTRAYLSSPILFEKDYVLELYFASISAEDNLKYKSAAAVLDFVRFTDGVAKSGSMYEISAVIQPETSIISELQNEVKRLSSETSYSSRNLFDRSKIKDGLVNSVDGAILTNTTSFPDASVSPVIDVEPNTYYTISGRTDTKGIVGYDINGNRVQIFEGSWATPDYNGSFITPSNVVQVQFSCTLRHVFSETDLIQFEKGEVATPYVEFGSTPITEKITDIGLKQDEMSNDIVAIREIAEDAIDTASNVLNVISGITTNSEMLFPNYTGATVNVSGSFPNWWGFTTVEDLPYDCFLTGITFSGSLPSDRTFNARISEKVRDADGNITGIQTVSDIFKVTLKAGESRIDLSFLPFSRNSVLEIEYGSVPTGLIKYTSGAANGQVWIKFKDQAVSPGSMWDVNVNLIPNNFLSESEKSDKTLKVLSIGNSFSQDAFGYVPYIFNKCCADINLTFGILYYGGASLENHYNFLVGENKEYTYHKSDKGGAWVNTSSYSIQDALVDEDWDIIVLQQNGRNAGDYNTMRPYLNNIIDTLFNMVSKPVRFAWHMTEAYSNDLETSVEQFTSYCNATREVLDKTIIDLIFPSATGLQNARTTTLQTLGDAGNMMHTSNHTQEGIPCYCLALPNVIVLLELCGYKYKGVFGEDTIPTQSWITSINMPGQNGVSVGATAENCKIAQKCAIMAVKNHYSITDCSEI